MARSQRKPRKRTTAKDPWRFPFGLLTILDLMGGAQHRSEGVWHEKISRDRRCTAFVSPKLATRHAMKHYPE